MKIILLIGLSIGLNLRAQQTNILGNRIINPNLSKATESTLFYSKLNAINSKIGLYESEVGAIYKLKNKYFLSSLTQYGYKNFKETRLSTSMQHQLSSSINLAASINYHHLYITQSVNYNAISIDIDCSISQERFTLLLKLVNPLNAEYLNKDLESKMLISPFYLWNKNLSSQLTIAVSQQHSIVAHHKLTYNYQNKFSLGISQGIKPTQIGFTLGYTQNNFQIFSQYTQYEFRRSTSLIILYSVSNE